MVTNPIHMRNESTQTITSAINDELDQAMINRNAPAAIAIFDSQKNAPHRFPSHTPITKPLSYLTKTMSIIQALSSPTCGLAGLYADIST